MASGEREPAQQATQRGDVDDVAAGKLPEASAPRVPISSGMGLRIAFSCALMATAEDERAVAGPRSLSIRIQTIATQRVATIGGRELPSGAYENVCSYGLTAVVRSAPVRRRSAPRFVLPGLG